MNFTRTKILFLSLTLIVLIASLLLYSRPNHTQVKSPEKECAQVTQIHEQAAWAGNPDSQTFLGLSYLHGKCVEQDAKKAFEYFREASTNGDANGQNNLGVSYITGTGVKQDTEQAVTWFKKSAEQGWSEAQFNLGICYSLGLGVPKDGTTARDWFLKSQKRGVHSKNDPRIEEKARPFIEGGSLSPDQITWIRNWADIGF